MKRVAHSLIVLLLVTACSKKVETVVTPPSPPVPPVVPIVDPNTLSLPVTAAQVNGAFSYTKTRNVHPRLHYTAAEIAQIGSAAQTDPFAKATYDDIIARADALIGSP